MARFLVLGALVAALAQPAAALELFASAGVIAPPNDGVNDLDAAEAIADFVRDASGVTLRSHGTATLGENGIVLRAQASASGTLTATTPSVYAVGVAGFTDHIVINGAGLSGTTGYLSLRLDYDGVLTSNGGGAGNFADAFGVACDDYANCTNSQVEVVDLAGIYASSGTQNIAASASLGQLQFTFGTPFDVFAYLLVRAGAGGSAGFSPSAMADFAHTATLGPAAILDGSGRRVAGVTVASVDSDYRYAVAVPEPTSWALMIVGFGAVGAAIRRKQAVAAV